MALVCIWLLADELDVSLGLIVKQCREHKFEVNCTSLVPPGLAGLIREWFADTKSPFLKKTPVTFRFRHEIREVKGWNEVLTGVCSLMAKRHPDGHEKTLLDFQKGRRRYYFSLKQEDVDQAQQIPGTRIYVMTQLNAEETVRRSREVIRRFGENPDDLKISAV